MRSVEAIVAHCKVGAALLVCSLSGQAATEAPIDPRWRFIRRIVLPATTGKVPRAPHMITFSTIGSEAVLTAMNEGVMRSQASALSATEREVLAGFSCWRSHGSAEPNYGLH